MNCHQCGAVVAVGENYCAVCGAALPLQAQELEPAEATHPYPAVVSGKDKAAGLLFVVAATGLAVVAAGYIRELAGAFLHMFNIHGSLQQAMAHTNSAQWGFALFSMQMLIASVFAFAAGIRSVMWGRGKIPMYVGLVFALAAVGVLSWLTTALNGGGNFSVWLTYTFNILPCLLFVAGAALKPFSAA